MREVLKDIGSEERHTFTGEFERFGEKPAYKGPIPIKTVLLVNVKDEKGNVVTDHIWFTCTKGFEACNLQERDIVQFDARVGTYMKGYAGYRDIEFYKPLELDYKLTYPTKISVIGKVEEVEL